MDGGEGWVGREATTENVYSTTPKQKAVKIVWKCEIRVRRRRKREQEIVCHEHRKNDCVVRRWMEEFFGWQTEVLGWWFSVRVSSTIPTKTGERKNNVKWKGDGMRGESVDGVGMSCRYGRTLWQNGYRSAQGESESQVYHLMCSKLLEEWGTIWNEFPPPKHMTKKHTALRATKTSTDARLHRVLTGFQARPLWGNSW
jgi:hypothetical protein